MKACREITKHAKITKQAKKSFCSLRCPLAEYLLPKNDCRLVVPFRLFRFFRVFRNLVFVALLTVPLLAQVPYERIRNAEREPNNWLTYSGNYASHHYSPLNQINRANVAQLKVAWMYQVRGRQHFETTPLVFDGVMYITDPPAYRSPDLALSPQHSAGRARVLRASQSRCRGARRSNLHQHD
jgi:hypothetical protein